MNRKRRRVLWYLILLLALAGCGQGEHMRIEDQPGEQEAGQRKPPLVGLILSSRDAEENEELIQQFEAVAKDMGAQLLVRIPEVSDKDAEEARGQQNSFVLCEVDPIEYQMLYVNEMVAKDADVIAICANHPQALEPVLAAARAVEVRVCAIEQEVGEESQDIYTKADEAAAAVKSLIGES